MSIDPFQTRSLRNRHSISIALFVCLFLIQNVQGTAPQLSSDMHEWALASIDNVYKEDLKAAEEEARKIIRKYPDHPAGYFFMAVVIDAWMSHFQSNKKENEFYHYCDEAIEKGERLLDKDHNNEWAKFFIGGADGYKGTYEARYERWITAFRYGWKGVSVLMSLESAGSKLSDIHYGIGSYEYWRSAMMRMLWWMPGIEDKRQTGIERLMKVRQDGIYTKTAASVSLMDILLNENRNSEALEIADEMLVRYRTALVFHWGRAKALYGLERYEESEAAFKIILSRAESEPFDNHHDAAICHLWLAKVNLKLQRYTQCIAECNRVGYYEFSEDIKRRLEKSINESNSVRKAAISQRSKTRETTSVP